MGPGIECFVYFLKCLFNLNDLYEVDSNASYISTTAIHLGLQFAAFGHFCPVLSHAYVHHRSSMKTLCPPVTSWTTL